MKSILHKKGLLRESKCIFIEVQMCVCNYAIPPPTIKFIKWLFLCNNDT
jgi:hypothetical protein